MQIQFVNSVPEAFQADALALLCFESESAGNALDAAPPSPVEDAPVVAQAGWMADLRRNGEFTGKLYETALLYRPVGIAATRLIAAGAGKQSRFSTVEARRVAGMLLRFAKSKGLRHLALMLPPSADASQWQAATEGALLGNWEPDKYKTDPKKNEKQVDTFTLLSPSTEGKATQAAIERGRIIAEAQNAARDLVNEPANKLTPAHLAENARAAAVELGLTCEVLDAAAMKELGMGALLGVAQGSSNPPFLIVLKYHPANRFGSDHLALVGKGVTFDTGGISIKPADGMEKMKYDMAGAAAVIGAMRAIAQLKPSLPVTGYIPTVENMLNGDAQRPGDIVTSLAGKTIEVLNTDAEGRLILADALTYA